MKNHNTTCSQQKKNGSQSYPELFPPKMFLGVMDGISMYVPVMVNVSRYVMFWKNLMEVSQIDYKNKFKLFFTCRIHGTFGKFQNAPSYETITFWKYRVVLKLCKRILKKKQQKSVVTGDAKNSKLLEVCFLSFSMTLLTSFPVLSLNLRL